MKRLDKSDHLHHKCDNKTDNFTTLSKRILHMRSDHLAVALCGLSGVMHSLVWVLCSQVGVLHALARYIEV